MIVTEEEAKTKRCCGPEGCGKANSDDMNKISALCVEMRPLPPEAVAWALKQADQMCIGSACMEWRWFGVVSTMLVDVNLPPPKHGYCGYARHG